MYRYSKVIFVFGSNEGGRHGAGAALDAYKNHGARYGMSYGLYGDSFAIPTKSASLDTLPMTTIARYVHGFQAFAESRPDWAFKVTRIGCGLAGLPDESVAARFQFMPSNCFFDEIWKPYLLSNARFWGTFP